MRFSSSSQMSISEKPIFGHFEVIVLKVFFFFRAGCLFTASSAKQVYFNSVDSLAGLSQKIFIFSQKHLFWQFWLPRSNFKVDFFNVKRELQKSFVKFVRG